MPKQKRKVEISEAKNRADDPICVKCHKKAVNLKIECSLCHSVFHPSCARAYIVNRPDTVCCVRSFARLLELASHTHNAHSACSPSLLSTPHSPAPSPSAASPNVHSLLLVSHTQNIEAHDNMTIIDPTMQDLLSAINSFKDELREDISSIKRDTEATRNDVAALTSAVQQNTAAYGALSADMAYLKRAMALARPTAELIINGIPAQCGLAHEDILIRVLTHLRLPGFHNDFISINKIDLKPNGSSRDTTRQYFALKVLCKSVEIRNAIIDAKRGLGTITVLELFPELSINGFNANKIYVNEFLPSSTYALLKKAKTAAKNAGYKRVWARNGNIFVRMVALRSYLSLLNRT